MTLVTSVQKKVDGVNDHSFLTGNAEDDHTQYHTDARGDARYYTQSQSDTTSGILRADITTNADDITLTSGTLQTQMDLFVSLTDYGNQSVVSGTNNVYIPLSTSVSGTYYISTSMRNTVDADPTVYSYMTTNTTTSGFTVKFSDNMDSSNYSIDWTIVR